MNIIISIASQFLLLFCRGFSHSNKTSPVWLKTKVTSRATPRYNTVIPYIFAFNGVATHYWKQSTCTHSDSEPLLTLVQTNKKLELSALDYPEAKGTLHNTVEAWDSAEHTASFIFFLSPSYCQHQVKSFLCHCSVSPATLFLLMINEF